MTTRVIVLHLVVYLLAKAILICSLSKLTNIDFLGKGYNGIEANPHGNAGEQGFKSSVIELAYSQNKQSADGQWLVPDDNEALQINLCDYSSKSSAIFGSQSYLNGLAADISFTTPTIAKLAILFTGGVGYSQIIQGTTSQQKVFYKSFATCMRYQAKILGNLPLKLSSNFIAAVTQMTNDSSDKALYIKLIQEFGTHYITSVSMGSKFVITYEFQQSKWTEMIDYGVNVNLGARALFDQIGFGMENSLNKATKEEFQESMSNYQETYVGSRPVSGSWVAWAEDSLKTLYPVNMEIELITELITPKYFPYEDSDELAAIKDTLKQVILSYCQSFGKPYPCGVLVKDDPLPILPTYTKKGKGTFFTCCPTNYKVLFCGLKNREISSDDSFRYSQVSNLDACECHDSKGVNCTATCTLDTKHVEIVNMPISAGKIVVAECPEGNKVIGCHLKPNTIGSGDSGPQFFSYGPIDSRKCECSFKKGPDATCSATCASNLIAHQIVSKPMLGSVKVTCPSGMYALGCGIRATGSNPESGKSDMMREVYVNSLTECICTQTAIISECTTICGKFNNSVEDAIASLGQVSSISTQSGDVCSIEIPETTSTPPSETVFQTWWFWTIIGVAGFCFCCICTICSGILCYKCCGDGD